MFLPALFVVLGACAAYFYNKWKFQYWKRLNVPHPKPHLIFGNLKDGALFRRSFGTIYGEIYNCFKGYPYVGLYLLRRPAIMVRDPEIIREVLVKDFTSFHDNDLYVDENKDPIFGCNPFGSRGELWKTRRARHTPHYTSGKIKSMLPVLDQVGDKMVDYVQREIKKCGGRFCVDANELAAKFTIDNVANCALGINGRTFETDDAELEVAGKKMFEPRFFSGAFEFLMFLVPSLANFFSIRVVPPDVTQMFRRLVAETLRYRKENNIVRNDFFDIVKQYKGKECSVDEIVVMVGAFYLDGFITSSTAMTFLLHELATNPACQEKLRKEIDDSLGKNDGKLTYETLQEDMPYLEAVISESLRKYTPLMQLTKVCTKEFTLPPASSSSKGVTVPIGTPLVIPITALHHDEKYFPNPEKFDPDRFLKENEGTIAKFTYLPFGDGPRSCLGMRFALSQLKVGIAKLISDFEISLNQKTISPIELEPTTLLLVAKGGVWIDLRKRRK